MSRRPAFAILSLLALLLFAPALVKREVFTFRDHIDYFQPLRWFTAVELRHGRLPLWNAYSASGEPWLANPQTGVFYPPQWLFLFLPFSPAYVLYLALHVALLGCGAWLLFSLRASPRAALAGAVALMFCGPVMSLLDVQNNLTTFAWLPLVLWCAVSRAPARRSSAAIAMSFLAGEPFFAALGALTFAVIRIRERRVVLDVAATSFALSAIQLLPFLATVWGSDRTGGGVPREQMLRDSMPPLDWLRIAVPPNLAAGAIDPHLHQHFIPIVYVGALTCFFALIGVAAGWRRRDVLAALGVIAACVVVAAAGVIAPVGELLVRLPLTLFRYPARVVPLAAMAIAFLAALGIDRVARGRWPLAVAALIAADLVLQIAPLLATAPFQPRVPYPRTVGRDAKIVRLGMERSPGIARRGWIAGYLNLYERRFDLWTAAPLSSKRYSEVYEAALRSRSPALLDALSAGYILSRTPVPGLAPIASAEGVTVYRNAGARPLALWSGNGGATRAANWIAFNSTMAVVSIDAPAGGTVTLSQVRAPGWRVTVDGAPAGDAESGLFRAVRVARGHHEIVWRARPRMLLAGALITLAAIARMLLSLDFVKRRATQKKFFRTRFFDGYAV